jgi:hypothetical protein
VSWLPKKKKKEKVREEEEEVYEEPELPTLINLRKAASAYRKG